MARCGLLSTASFFILKYTERKITVVKKLLEKQKNSGAQKKTSLKRCIVCNINYKAS